MNSKSLISYLDKHYRAYLKRIPLGISPATYCCDAEHYIELCRKLKDDSKLSFDTLIDLCGIDYLHYGIDEWSSTTATSSGFSRGANLTSNLDSLSDDDKTSFEPSSRFAINLQLLSVRHNHRLAIKVFLSNSIVIDTVKGIWSSADWYEREAFDLYGIIFKGHEDLRRLLTDYGFVGHPFRKDFPISGHSEVRYDSAQGRVVYEPVSIEPRVPLPKSRRTDSRYENDNTEVNDA
jgi:NADH-quinone oxidoreductase subunit C